MFPQDNNGFAIVLPQVGATGAVSVSGSMIFGIGTQSNNGLGSAQAQAANENTGNFNTTFNGVLYSNSYIDSGSNGLFFLDSTTSGLPNCSSSSGITGFYCPAVAGEFHGDHQRAPIPTVPEARFRRISRSLLPTQ